MNPSKLKTIKMQDHVHVQCMYTCAILTLAEHEHVSMLSLSQSIGYIITEDVASNMNLFQVITLHIHVHVSIHPNSTTDIIPSRVSPTHNQRTRRTENIETIGTRTHVPYKHNQAPFIAAIHLQNPYLSPLGISTCSSRFNHPSTQKRSHKLHQAQRQKHTLNRNRSCNK